MYAPTRTLLRATFIVSALMPAALASAADFPLPPPLPASTWAGFYIGGQIGGFGGTSTFSDPYGPSVFGDKVTTNGFLAGLQLGYDWQVAPKWVVGVVADTSYLDGKGSFTCMRAAATIIGSNCEVTTRALATMAGRVGFLVDPLNHTLVYGKAGGAWTDSHVSIHPGNAPFGDFPGAEFPGSATSANANAWGGMIGPDSSTLLHRRGRSASNITIIGSRRPTFLHRKPSVPRARCRRHSPSIRASLPA